MIPAPEHLADLHERHRQKFGDKIDCDHSRFDDVFGFLFGYDVRRRDFEVFANRVHDSACVDGVVLFLDKAADSLFCNVYSANRTVGERTVKNNAVEQAFHLSDVGRRDFGNELGNVVFKHEFGLSGFVLRIATLVSVSGT